MAKGCRITFYRSVSDLTRLTGYDGLAGPADGGGGGRFWARGLPTETVERVEQQRSTLIEFDSVQQAITTYRSPRYQAARRLLAGAVERDVRIMEGVG